MCNAFERISFHENFTGSSIDQWGAVDLLSDLWHTAFADVSTDEISRLKSKQRKQEWQRPAGLDKSIILEAIKREEEAREKVRKIVDDLL